MEYKRPIISFIVIELEAGVCTGSAIVKPQNQKNEVLEEWETVEEPTRTIDW